MTENSIDNNVKKGKKLILDFGFNILATVIQTAVLQIILYPFLASLLDSSEYGQLLTIIGIVNIIVVSVGGGLNNTRLIQRNAYEESKGPGDFNRLLFLFSSISTLLFSVLIATRFNTLGIEKVILIACVIIGIVNNYWTVEYRLHVDYKRLLVYNVVRAIGYILGLKVIDWSIIWPVPFLCGEVFGFCFLLKTTSLYKEKLNKTLMFSQTCKVYITLICTNIIANFVVYLDRIFLYPILGGEQVTIYTVSSFVGKSIGMLIIPMSSVLLSYYAQKNFNMTIKKYWYITSVVLGMGGLIGILAIFFAPWITTILYPTVVKETINYIVIANVATLVGALSNILSPSVLKFASIRWQIIIQGVYATSYILLGYYAVSIDGLKGFCVATLIVNTIKLLMYMLIGHFSIIKNNG